MNNDMQSQFDPENAPAFDRLRDRRRAKRRRVLRVVLTLLGVRGTSGRRSLLRAPAIRKALSRHTGHEQRDRRPFRA